MTNTQTSPARHRHVVVAPLFMLALLLTTQGENISKHISASLTESQTGHVVLNGGVADASAPNVLRQEGDRVTIHDGTALVLAEGPVGILWNGAKVTGWAGAFHLVAGQVLTVSAITTPVLIEQGKAKTIVPIGMQYRFNGTLPDVFSADRATWFAARKLLPLPADFLTEQIMKSQSLDVGDRASVEPSPFAIIDAYLQLPAAQERAEAIRLNEALDPLEAAIRAGDAVRTQELLAAAHITPESTDPAVIARAPLLLGLAALHDVPVQTTLVPLIVQRDDLWLLSAVHPKLEGAHWLLDDGADRGPESMFLRVWILPIVDNRAMAFASTTPVAWGKMLSEFLYAQEDPSADTALFLRIMNAIVATHRAGDRPERAVHYAQAAYEALLPFETLLTDEEKSVLASLEQSDAYLLDANVMVSSVSSAAASSVSVKSESSSSAPTMHPDEAVSRAKADLSAVGMMFTKDSMFKPKGTAVAISNVVLATPKGDQYFNFTYDVEAREVDAIADDGKAYPYALPLQKFVEWVKAGE